MKSFQIIAITARLACSLAAVSCSMNEPAPSPGAEPSAGSSGSSSAGSGGGDGDVLPSAGTGGSGAGTDSGGGSSAAGSGGLAGGGSSNVVPEDNGTEGDGTFMLQGPYQAAPELKRQNDAPTGKLVRFTIPGKSSAIYPNAPDRDIAAYVPQQYVKGTPAPVMVVQDGTDFYGFDGMMPVVFDNLIDQKKIPIMVVVFTGNGGGDSVGSERGLEYDTVSGLYAEWADKELLPAVEQATQAQLPEQAVTFTKDAYGRGAIGGSSGGAASFSMAWWRPDLFRRVITFSGTYVTQVPKDSPFPHGAWIYHDIDPYDPATPNGLISAFCESAGGPKTTGQVEPCDTPLSESACLAVSGCAWNTSVNKPLRVWLEAGSNDNGASGQPSSYRNFHLANQRMAQALAARGYHVHFDDCAGAGHVDQGPIRQTFPSALIWLWRGYK